MTLHRIAAPAGIALLAGTLLSGCAQTPLGPTVNVMPGPGKSFDMFQGDQASCKTFAASQVQGQADAANKQGVGAALLTTALGAGLGAAAGSVGGVAGSGAAVGAAAGVGLGTGIGAQNSAMAQGGIQQQYDNAFAQCMYAKGELVPGFAPVGAGPGPAPTAGSGADPHVLAVQQELIRLHYLNGAADGMMGPKTQGAIASYERANGLPVDGEPSPPLLARLQATPTAQAAGATASAPSNWVAPAGAAAPAGVMPAAAPAPAPNWVAPTNSQ